MRYSITEGERTSDNTNEKNDEIKFDDEEITEKIPIEKFCQINNAQLIFDEPASLVRFVLLQANPEYINYFGPTVYAIIIKSENNVSWFGVPVKNPNVGLMRWDKSRWNKLYSFSLSMTMQED